jgi:hypothetical protein
MRKLVLSFVVGAAALSATPAAARTHPAPKAAPMHSQHRDVLPVMLRARLASINARIDMLRESGALGSEEAQDLRKQARRLQGQSYGLSAREEGNVLFGIDRLESRVSLVADDARWGGHSFNRDFTDLHEDRDERNRYDAERHGDYEHFDRYTGSSVDRWHDPFDRGNEL